MRRFTAQPCKYDIWLTVLPVRLCIRVAIGVLVLLRRLHVGGRCPGPVQRRGGEHRQIQPPVAGRFVEQALQLWNARQAPVHALSLPALHRAGRASARSSISGLPVQVLPSQAMPSTQRAQIGLSRSSVTWGAVCRHHQPVGSHRLGLRQCGTRAGKAQPGHARALQRGHGNPMRDGQRLKTFHGSHSFMHPAKPVSVCTSTQPLCPVHHGAL